MSLLYINVVANFLVSIRLYKSIFYCVVVLKQFNIMFCYASVDACCSRRLCPRTLMMNVCMCHFNVEIYVVDLVVRLHYLYRNRRRGTSLKLSLKRIPSGMMEKLIVIVLIWQ